jgi:hypothetical protein
MEDTNLEQIITVFENIEKDSLGEDPKIKEWIKNITNSEFQLIDSLLNLFLDNVENTQEMSKSILKVLR